ncbi:MAG: hypothetical protein JRG96_09985 [Deltaproteobacteria bacterium]|nr:hypothetical protein [Deltaproteobacteria bacterium]MBW2417679.1 hypothetical protein [Deltaproteobacteria bacterium]
MSAKREAIGVRTRGSGGEQASALWRRIRRDLEARGVAADLAGELARHLEVRIVAGGHDRYDSLLDGAALASRAQCDADTKAERNSRDLQEVERMMSAFAEELSKLDETLEVLAAYVRRMRTSSGPRPDPTLH